MADVSRLLSVGSGAGENGGDDRDRGQLIIVAGVALALVFVGLALVLNSAIYTENLATRQDQSGVGDTVRFQSQAESAVGETIDTVNANRTGNDYTTLRTHYRDTLDAVENRLAQQSALHTGQASIDHVESYEGTRIVDNDSSTTLTAHTTPLLSVAGNWNVTNDSHVRAFELSVEGSTVPSAVESDVRDQLSGSLSDLTYQVEWTEPSGDTWRAAVYDDGSINVLVYDVATGTFYGPCTSTESFVNISVVAGTVDGDYCAALAVADWPDGAYDVRYYNGDLVEGTYELTVDRQKGRLEDAVDIVNYGDQCGGPTYADAGSGNTPFTAPAIYSGTVELDYQNEDVEYGAETRVAPGQAGDALTTPRVTQFDVSDASDDDSFTVDWATEDPNGDPVSVELRLVDDGGTQVDSEGSLSGSGSGETLVDGSATPTGPYEVRLVATAGSDTRTATQTHADDGDSSGCPP